ncbi:MAG: hypothetical protein EP330_23480 [Deltaproteobacteria bacterium]|nr:MAG: hypothetical protein EP330_23480 [Deltaproteobacteria bacterium]
MSDDTTQLKDFLGGATPAPSPRRLPAELEETRTAATQSMGTFLDAVGADLEEAPATPNRAEATFDPSQSLAGEDPPEDHRSFLASMGVPVTPAPVQRRTRVAAAARKAAEVAEKNMVPSLLMAIAFSLITFWLVGIF